MPKDSNSQVRYFDRYICGVVSGYPEYDHTNKSRCINQHISYMLNRTHAMFEWDGLPGTIPARILELYLQTNGNVAFYEHNNKLYVFTGGLGGEPNEYYMPTIYTIANPALDLFVNAKIGVDCVIMPNDTMYLGLLPLCARYASAITEVELSTQIAAINSRIFNLISAPDDRTKASAEQFLKDIADGKMGVIAENGFLDGIKSQPYGTTGSTNILTNLVELTQYIKASWYNELGLNANFNMKRESLNTTESELNDDALLPLIDDMLSCRQRGADEVNRMFGTNITVKLSSAWEDTQIESESAIDESVTLDDGSEQIETQRDF